MMFFEKSREHYFERKFKNYAMQLKGRTWLN